MVVGQQATSGLDICGRAVAVGAAAGSRSQAVARDAITGGTIGSLALVHWLVLALCIHGHRDNLHRLEKRRRK